MLLLNPLSLTLSVGTFSILHVEFYILVSRLPRLKTGHSWHTLCSQSSRPVVYVLSGVGEEGVSAKLSHVWPAW